MLLPASASYQMADCDYEAYVPLPDMRFEVDDPCEQLGYFLFTPWNGCRYKSLELGDQEVTLRQKNCCGVKKQSRTYAQLGSGTSKSLLSDFGNIKSGCCGSNSTLTDQINAELKVRKEKRGGIAQTSKLDYTLAKMYTIATQVPQLLDKLGVQYSKTALPTDDSQTTLPEKTFDVTGCMQRLRCAKASLTLGADEATLTRTQCCGIMPSSTKREYGEVGSVRRKKTCFVHSLSSNLSTVAPGLSGNITPGCPCTNRKEVNVLLSELRARMALRGQAGRIRKQQKVLVMLANVDTQMQAVLGHQGVKFPPTQKTMTKMFGSEVKDWPRLGVKEKPIETVECKKLEVGEEKWDLNEDGMVIHSTNRLANLDSKLSYNEIDGVDATRTCCCAYCVNDKCVGCGDQPQFDQLLNNCCCRLFCPCVGLCCGLCKTGHRDRAKGIAADLQERRLKLGNLAHLKQLRTMQDTATGVEVMADLLMKQQGIEFPPDQDLMKQVWPDQTPKCFTHDLEMVVGDKDMVVGVKNKEFSEVKKSQNPEFQVSNTLEAWILGPFCKTKRLLELEPEDMVFTLKNCCVTSKTRTHYSNLGDVQPQQCCSCCHTQPDVGCPGCGCSQSTVVDIAEELQRRKEKFGTVAQMKQQEIYVVEVLNIEAKIALLLHKHGLLSTDASKNNLEQAPVPVVMGKGPSKPDINQADI